MNTLRNARYSTKKGFTLVEMAIVLVIVGLLIGGGFSTLGAYLDNAKQSHTLGSLKVTKQALLNYVKVNKHMPCPDVYGDGDGKGDDTGVGLLTQCSSDVGTIPFDDLGLGRGITADDYGNLFSYGIHKEAADPLIMGLNIASPSEAIALRGFAGSYFYNLGAPAFDLDTPPTEAVLGSLVNSYQVCNRNAQNDCGGTNDVEVQFIPAVIVAFNENGDGTSLAACGAATTETRETENCDGDMRLIRGSFQKDVFDDQMVTISAYEIKEYALGAFKNPPSSSLELPPWAGYDYIVNKDLTSTNDFNSASGDAGVDVGDDGSFEQDGDSYGDSLYVTGNVEANINMLNGSNKLLVEGNVSATVNGGTGVDFFNIGGSVDSDGRIELEDGADTLTIEGDVAGEINGGGGGDVIVIKKNVYGTVNMGTGGDDLTINGDIHSAVYGGAKKGPNASDIDTIRVNKTRAAFITSGQESFLNQFTQIYFSDSGPEALPIAP